MATPTILYNSSTGSDSLASGAGPATAKTGTAASVAGTATSVSITDAVDLSGVATDGTAVLYYADATAGHRNFDNITGISGSSGAWTVTVANGFTTTTGPFSWAIGGKRLTLSGTVSKKLIDNNLAAGDAMAGWTLQLEDSYTETIAATLTFRRAGDATNGPIRLIGDPAATTMPILTFSNNGSSISSASSVNRIVIGNITFKNSNATKTASFAIGQGAASQWWIYNLRINDAANKYWKGIVNNASAGGTIIERCSIANTASIGIDASASLTIRNCFIRSCGSHGITLSGTGSNANIMDNIIANNTGDGINDARTGTTSGICGLNLRGNVIDGNGSDGLEITGDGSTVTTSFLGSLIENNEFTRNGAYGINLSGSPSQASLNGCIARIRNNNFGTGATANTTAPIFPTTLTLDSTNLSVNPGYVNSGGNDWSVGTNVKALGYPTTAGVIGGDSSTTSYVDIGPQRQETGSAGGGANLLGNGTLVSS